MQFHKYHGLGNDYLVLEPAAIGRELSPGEIRRICDRNYGVGADGILWGPAPAPGGAFALRIFNPDASEAEKSGNGLRIFARHLHERGLVGTEPFPVLTKGGRVLCRVHRGGSPVEVEMGRVSFEARDIPVLGVQGEVIDQPLLIAGRALRYSAATVGNPHCVIPLPAISSALARELGPLVENDPRFPNRTNVQLLEIVDRGRIRIEIWERGAGYTLASGSSSVAAAAVARRLGHCDGRIAVAMPGGTLHIELGDDWAARMTGPVTRVAAGTLFDDAFSGV